MTFLRIGLAVGLLAASGCKSQPPPAEMVGSYTRSGDLPGSLRAELSVARGGIVLTVARASASVDLGVFGSLFTDKDRATAKGGGSATASSELGRSVVSARTFRKVACEGTLCRFELAAEDGLDACSGTFEKVQSTLVVVAGGVCQGYSGRWVVLENGGAIAPALAASDAGAPAPGPSLDFPPDIPAPRDSMSCLNACSIVDTRCHRESANADRAAFLACVEKGQICRARCEQAFPFFGHTP